MTLITPPLRTNLTHAPTTYHIVTTLEDAAHGPKGFNATLERPEKTWLVDSATMGTTITRIFSREALRILNHPDQAALRVALIGSSCQLTEAHLSTITVQYRVQGWYNHEPAAPKSRGNLRAYVRVLGVSGTTLLGDTRILVNHDLRVQTGTVVSSKGCPVRGLVI